MEYTDFRRWAWQTVSPTSPFSHYWFSTLSNNSVTFSCVCSIAATLTSVLLSHLLCRRVVATFVLPTVENTVRLTPCDFHVVHTPSSHQTRLNHVLSHSKQYTVSAMSSSSLRESINYAELNEIGTGKVHLNSYPTIVSRPPQVTFLMLYSSISKVLTVSYIKAKTWSTRKKKW